MFFFTWQIGERMRLWNSRFVSVRFKVLFLLPVLLFFCLVCSAAVNHFSVVSSDVKVASGGLCRGHFCGQLGFQHFTSSPACSTDPGSEPSGLAANNIISPSCCNQWLQQMRVQWQRLADAVHSNYGSIFTNCTSKCKSFDWHRYHRIISLCWNTSLWPKATWGYLFPEHYWMCCLASKGRCGKVRAVKKKKRISG